MDLFVELSRSRVAYIASRNEFDEIVKVRFIAKDKIYPAIHLKTLPRTRHAAISEAIAIALKL